MSAEAVLLERPPAIRGRSKEVWELGRGECLVRLLPTLRSYTHARDEVVPRTEVLRLDFYELAAERLAAAGVPTVFRERLGPDLYRAAFRPHPPVETIVKNAAYGSTLRNYPGLFAEGARFGRPVVKFDLRLEPEDVPIADDYVRELGLRVEEVKALALAVNDELRAWLAPREVVDFCLVVAADGDAYTVVSEISPDCMRIRSGDGAAWDKDLFRAGASPERIVERWQALVDDVRRR